LDGIWGVNLPDPNPRILTKQDKLKKNALRRFLRKLIKFFADATEDLLDVFWPEEDVGIVDVKQLDYNKLATALGAKYGSKTEPSTRPESTARSVSNSVSSGPPDAYIYDGGDETDAEVL
jgi:hypothetical protein